MEISGNVPPEWQEILEQAKQVEEEERRNRLPSEAPRVPSPGGNGAHSSPTDDFRRAQYYTAKVPGAGQGNRNSCLNHLAFHLLELFPSLTEIQHRELCMNWAASCNPPYDREGTEAEKTIGSGWKSAHAKGAVGAKYNPPIERRLVPEVHERETEIFFPEETAPGGNGSHVETENPPEPLVPKKDKKATKQDPLEPFTGNGRGIQRPIPMQGIVSRVGFLEHEGVTGVLPAKKYLLAKVSPVDVRSGPNNTMLCIACSLVRGFKLTEEEAFGLLLEFNKECLPPWPEDALRKKIKEASRAIWDEDYLLQVVRVNEKRDRKNIIPSGRLAEAAPPPPPTGPATTAEIPEDETVAPAPPAPPEPSEDGNKEELNALPAFYNAVKFVADYTDTGKPIYVKQQVGIDKISEMMNRAKGNWPRCVSRLLFADEKGKIRMLEETDALFAWLHEKFRCSWFSGQDTKDLSVVTKSEFYSHTLDSSITYASVEIFPHHPMRDDSYYSWIFPEDYAPDGTYLQELLSFFSNVETEQDAAIIKALFMTPAWGCEPGSRPAFAITATDRGFGKSTLADAVGILYGGYIEMGLTKRDEDYIVSRLLSPDALTKRVVRIDNHKDLCSSAILEGLISSPIISGHRLHHGEASRPNTLTFILTGNSLRLSRDMSDRCFVIKLKRPDYNPGWREHVMKFVKTNQKYIISDIIFELKREPKEIKKVDRWASFCQYVLSKCSHRPEDIVVLTQQRRDQCDEEIEEGQEIMDALDQYLDRQSALLLEELFLSTAQATEIVNSAMNQNWSSRYLSHKLASHVESGRMPRVKKKRTKTCNGFSIVRRSVHDFAENEK